MTEDPYRWLEAINNRREYIRSQLKGGSPVLAASLNDGILVLGVGSGQSKVFEIFDRQALAGIGHPADLERIRQAIIDAAHLEAFTRAPEDVALRRLVSHGLGPQLKAAFEQIFAPPFLLRLLLAEVGDSKTGDSLIKIGFDGTFAIRPAGIAVVTDDAEQETESEARLAAILPRDADVPAAAALLLQEWHRLTAEFTAQTSDEPPGIPSILAALQDRVIEAALLRRDTATHARYSPLTRQRLGFPENPALPSDA